MASTEETTRFEIIDHNIAAGYVTYIVDLWDGDRDDPVTDVTRYIGVWRADSLENEEGEAFDPDFTKAAAGHYSSRRRLRENIEDGCIHWEVLEEIKKGDRESQRYKAEVDSLIYKEDGYYYGARAKEAKLYTAFLEAIDLLADDPENKEGWLAVERWRTYNAQMHEK